MQLEDLHILEGDYYQELEIAPEATALEVEAAFKRITSYLDLKHEIQSQRLLAAEKMLRVTQAYEVLSDPIARSHYEIRRFGRGQLPSSSQVVELFRAGIKGYRNDRLEMALRYFKEVIRLYPHRSLYRIHLAIIYHEKQWLANTENELETALKLDPGDRFAKETVARLLFMLGEDAYTIHETSFVRKVGTGILSLMKTGPLGKGRTAPLDDKRTGSLK